MNMVALLHMIAGAFGLVLGIFILAGALGASLLIGLNATSDEALIAVPVITVIGLLLSGLTMICPLLGILTGIGLLRRAPWSRVLCIVVSILYIPVYVPFGALLGIYSLWVMVSNETSVLFQNPPA
ncbi:MAG TPA: hypothetical protein PK878_03550 [bacterium]|nr:hypothetical protein [Candidatus Omnitrophota bacterium]HOJ59337.1 hypothetical protein [bacterium]HOL96522.1 hypothetical protein [bacterium]HPP02598.1 hypothetical protein [bacterium]HXK93599.1 hypothetical protein [bacterium]